MRIPRRPSRGPRLASAATGVAVAVLSLICGCSTMRGMSQRIHSAVAGPQAAEAPAPGTVVLQPLAPVRRDIFTRSYRLGETYSAHTGEPVVSIKNYSITERVGHATVLRDFGQTCKRGWLPGGKPVLCENAPLSAVRGAMGSVLDVAAAVTEPDGQFFAVALPSDGQSQVYLLADPTGRLRHRAYIAWREELSPGFSLGRQPLVELAPDVAMDSGAPLFSFESVEKFVFMGPGYLSFDLVFTGTRDTVRGDLMTFAYREFGRDSTDRPVFERNLQFPATDKVIEVQKLQIEVEPVGYGELRFRVIADGQPAPTTR